jgi:hypothetical protein
MNPDKVRYLQHQVAESQAASRLTAGEDGRSDGAR